MSVHTAARRLTAADIGARKGGEPIVALTASHSGLARIIDPHCDVLLVGDSLGMVAHGHETTVPVTLDMMILHGSAVVRSTSHALIVVDLPFGAYEESPETAFRAAARVMKETGCGAVKLEGGARMAATIRFLVERGIPVLAHIGLTPQAINVLGAFRAQGRSRDQWPLFEADARAVTEAGAFAVVIEAVAEPLAALLTKNLPIPTIGIGASPQCDGQILVTEDMLGLTSRTPKFVRRYAELAQSVEQAAKAYAEDVKSRDFPDISNIYSEIEPT